MRTNVKLRINSIIIIVFFFISCQKKQNAYYFDFTGDLNLDTLVIKDSTKSYIKNLYILKNRELKKIVSFLPMGDSSHVSTKPQIENIYIEANQIQSKEKGIRVIIRNTDLIPDIFFIDIYHKDKWYVEYYGIMNTNSSDSLYIKKVKINRSFIKEFDKGMICNPKEIIQKYNLLRQF
jgi:hypothetical protein